MSFLDTDRQINNNLKEIHYIPFNTSNSLTIYSYTKFRNHVLTATKENFIKDVYFKNVEEESEEEEKTKLEVVNEIHKFQKIPKGALISTIDVIDFDKFCVFNVAFTVVS